MPQYVTVVGGGSLFAETSAGLVIGERQHGLYRLLAGDSSFEPLGTPGIGLTWFRAADGVWTVTDTGMDGGQESGASFYNGSDQPATSVGFDGFFAGADDNAIYVEYQLDSDTADSLVMYPLDASAPTTIACGGFVTNPFGVQQSLVYNDAFHQPAAARRRRRRQDLSGADRV